MMMINIILLVIWLFLGFLVFLSAKDDGMVSVWCYFACWIVLILQLIMNILEGIM